MSTIGVEGVERRSVAGGGGVRVRALRADTRLARAEFIIFSTHFPLDVKTLQN